MGLCLQDLHSLLSKCGIEEQYPACEGGKDDPGATAELNQKPVWISIGYTSITTVTTCKPVG